MRLKGVMVDGAAGNMQGRLFCGFADLEQLQLAELQAPARVQGQTRYQVLADDGQVFSECRFVGVKGQAEQAVDVRQLRTGCQDPADIHASLGRNPVVEAQARVL